MNAAEKIEQLVRAFCQATGSKAVTGNRMDERILADALTAYKETETETASKRPGTWRRIMKSSISKLAAAVIIVAALIAGIYIFSGPGAGIALADVLAPILNARTASMDIIIGPGGNESVVHDDILGSRIRRTVPNIVGADIIIDLEQGKMLTLNRSSKTAVYIDLAGLDDVKNYMEYLQNLVTKLEEKGEYQIEDCGLQTLEGGESLVFVASGQNDTITIWADPQNALPIRMEQITPNMRIVCDNLKFDVELDQSLFSMQVPEGYVVRQSGIDFNDAGEDAFIETLRIWADIIEDGYFPDSINLEDVVKVGPKFGLALQRANLSEQETLEIAARFSQGFVFIRFFKGQGQWHYAGKGVKFGDAETPIFWYQPNDSDTWRVIYGDLHVEDVEQENLPEEPAEEQVDTSLPQTKSLGKEGLTTEQASYDFRHDKRLPPRLIERIESMLGAWESRDARAWLANFNIDIHFDLVKGKIKYSDHPDWFGNASQKKADQMIQACRNVNTREELFEILLSDARLPEPENIYVRSVNLAANGKHADAVCVKVRGEKQYVIATPEWAYFQNDWWQTDD